MVIAITVFKVRYFQFILNLMVRTYKALTVALEERTCNVWNFFSEIMKKGLN